MSRALALAPVAIAGVYFGSPYIEIMITLAALLMAWEWDRLCGAVFDVSGYVMVAAIVTVGAAAFARRFDLVVVILVIGTAAVYVASRLSAGAHPRWIASGTLIIGAPCATVMWLRADPVDGLPIVLWLVGAVWMTDIAAFVVGRSVGGRALGTENQSPENLGGPHWGNRRHRMLGPRLGPVDWL